MMTRSMVTPEMMADVGANIDGARSLALPSTGRHFCKIAMRDQPCAA